MPYEVRCGMPGFYHPPNEFSPVEDTNDASPAAIVSAATPCRGVWIAVADDSTVTLLIGDSSGQDLELDKGFDIFIPIDDASKVYVQGNSGEATYVYNIVK